MMYIELKEYSGGPAVISLPIGKWDWDNLVTWGLIVRALSKKVWELSLTDLTRQYQKPEPVFTAAWVNPLGDDEWLG